MITREFTATLTATAAGPTLVPIGIELAYDDDNDPLAVTMTCSSPQMEDPVVWVFAFDLFTQGAQQRTRPVGYGDVKVQRVSDTCISISLENESGTAHISLPYKIVSEFLSDAIRTQPNNPERLDELIDAGIKEILDS